MFHNIPSFTGKYLVTDALNKHIAQDYECILHQNFIRNANLWSAKVLLFFDLHMTLVNMQVSEVHNLKLIFKIIQKYDNQIRITLITYFSKMFRNVTSIFRGNVRGIRPYVAGPSCQRCPGSCDNMKLCLA